MPGATVAILVLFSAAIAEKLTMIPPDRAEEPDKRCGRGERGEKRQADLEAPQLGVEREAHRPLDSVAALDRGFGQAWHRRARLGSAAAMTTAAGSLASVRPAAASRPCGEARRQDARLMVAGIAAGPPEAPQHFR
jgi:hypothetical protein